MSIDFYKNLIQTNEFHSSVKKEPLRLGKVGGGMPIYPNIKNARTSRNLSQQSAADFLGITSQQYSLYETGQREMPMHHFITLAKFYGVTLDYLAGLTDEQGNPS